MKCTRRTWAAAAALLAAGTVCADPPGRGEGYGFGSPMGHRMYGGPGMGPGMGMMGPGMEYGMGMLHPGRGPGGGLRAWIEQLGEEQRAAGEKILDELRRKRWELAGRIMDERAKLRDAFSGARIDRAAALAASRRIAELREQMFAAWLDAQEKLEALLAPEQRGRLRRQLRERFLQPDE